MIYFDKKILYVCTLNSSLGDTVNNAYAWLGKLKNLHPRSVVHALFHVMTNEYAAPVLIKRGMVDHVYPIDFMREPLEAAAHPFFKQQFASRVYDLILFTPWDDVKTQTYLMRTFPSAHVLKTERTSPDLAGEFLADYQTRISKFDIDHYNGMSLPEMFHRDFTKAFVSDCLDISKDKGYSKSVCIFGASSRKLANVGSTGLQNIVNACNKNGVFCFISGTSIENCYNYLGGVDWQPINGGDYGEGSCNVVGAGWEKTLALIEATHATITGPTGICMVPPMFGKKLIWMAGGDSRIMFGCLHSYTNRKDSLQVGCLCPHYPCPNGDLTKKRDSEKEQSCYDNRNPSCLNEEINTAGLETILQTI